jgi:hypothetical protein
MSVTHYGWAIYPNLFRPRCHDSNADLWTLHDPMGGHSVLLHRGVEYSRVRRRLLYYRQYNKRHERRTIGEFQLHQLRPYIQEQLEPKYFQSAPPTK